MAIKVKHLLIDIGNCVELWESFWLGAMLEFAFL